MLQIHANETGPALRMPWRNGIAVGRAAELLRSDLLDHLRRVQNELGFRYCRFHGLFHDDMAVALRRPDGRLAFQWRQVDQVFDSLLELGLRPFVELGPMPRAMASGTETMFHWKMNITPPSSYGEWAELVDAFTRHMIRRYGLAEVRQWYFEVWNEPNLSCFWTGTQTDYWTLYATAARALKQIDSDLRVGGPATSKASWIGDFINHCTQENVPLDFVSTHLYPQDEYVTYPDRAGSPHRPGDFFADTIRGVREFVDRSQRPDLEIHWTEWNTLSAPSSAAISWTHNPTVDSLFAASFIVRNCLALDDACDTLAYWVASDVFEEGGLPHSPFSCTYGLVTIHGIPKAAFNAFALLRRMQGGRLTVKAASGLPEGCGLFATAEGDVVRALAWNHQRIELQDQPAWKDVLRIVNPVLGERGASAVVAARIRAGAGSPWETWCALGRPHTLSPMEEKLLRAHADPEYSCALHEAADGTLDVPFHLGPGEVLLLEIAPAGVPAMAKTTAPEDLAQWDRMMGEASR